LLGRTGVDETSPEAGSLEDLAGMTDCSQAARQGVFKLG
jgi:hypothetical protein